MTPREPAGAAGPAHPWPPLASGVVNEAGEHGLPEPAARLAHAVAALSLPHRATFEMVGQRVGVQTSSADLLERVHEIWHPFAVERREDAQGADEPRGCRYTLLDVGPPEARSPLGLALLTAAGAAALDLSPHRFLLMSATQGIYSRDRVDHALACLDWLAGVEVLTGSSAYAIFHSAVLARGERGLMLPAASGSGKTTLTAALVRAGFGYLSDEAALVDPLTHRVDAYPKLLSVKRPAITAQLLALPGEVARRAPAQVGLPWLLDPNLLTGGCVRQSTRIAAIVFPRYEAGAPTTLQPLSWAAAAVRLLKCGTNAAARPPQGVAVATALAGEVATCAQLVFSDLQAAVRLVSALFDHAAPEPVATGQEETKTTSTK